MTPLRTRLRSRLVLTIVTAVFAAATASPAVMAAQSPTDPLGWRPCAYLPTPPDAVWGPSKNVGSPPAEARLSPSDLMTIVTNRGTLRIRMLTSAAPCTVNSFRFLASRHYFDGTHCHRLTTSGIYVLQCGDPSGTGSGGPGYMFQDENLVGASYPAGSVAMANAGPDTNGSQFFITYKDSSISPLYTPFGRVVGNGLDVVRYVAAGGCDNANGAGDGHPRRFIRFTSLRLSND
jgi:peptidyl-prolyl cis-trans isomerase B (cyclophilin B)